MLSTAAAMPMLPARAVALAAALLLGTSGCTGSAILPSESQAYHLVSLGSGKCLDVEGAAPADGATVLQWACEGGSHQIWQLRRHGDRFYHIIAKHSGKCLALAGADSVDPGYAVQMPCGAAGHAEQDWRLERIRDERVKLVSRDGRCLDVEGGQVGGGARILGYACGRGQPNQLWRLTPAIAAATDRP